MVTFSVFNGNFSW